MCYKQHIIVIIFLLFIFSCKNEHPEVGNEPGNPQPVAVLDTIEITNKSLDILIPFSARLESWRRKTITTGDSTRIISLLAEAGQDINAGQHLMSLWHISPRKEFTPFDVKAPFSGIVDQVHVRINQRLSKGEDLITILNNDFFKAQVRMEHYQVPYIKRGQYVLCGRDDLKFEGIVDRVEHKSRLVSIKLFNDVHKTKPTTMVNGHITIPAVKGSFIRSKFIREKDYINVFVDDETIFKVYEVGQSDSLSLLSTTLTKFEKIRIVRP